MGAGIVNTDGGHSEITTGVREGDVIAGKYHVEKLLGSGGMGVVVAARHIELDEMVAIKFLLPQALRSPDTVARFVREARAAVKIKSEHVARVTDVGKLENGAAYMVMEYLDGMDLAAWIHQRGPLPIHQSVDFVLQACVALADAHNVGIVHRDLKPANLFCVRRSDGQLHIKVLDFGISKGIGATGPSPLSLTKTTAMMGSPLYMSPEQMRTPKGVDSRTDIWAMGVVLHELIAGHPPFEADTLTELAIKVANEPPRPLRSYRPDLPAGLEQVISTSLEKDPARRYRHVGELAEALLPFGPPSAKTSVERISAIIREGRLSGNALAILPSAFPAAPSQPSAGTLPAIARTTMGARRGQSLAIGAGAVGAVMVASLVAWLLLFRGGPGREDPRTAVTPTAPSSVVTEEPLAAPPVVAPEAEPAGPETSAAAAAPPLRASSDPTGRSPGRGPARATPTGTPAAVTPAVAPPAKKPNCIPPYYFDSSNHKQYKPECI